MDMAFYSGVFTEGEVSIRVLHHELVAPNLVQAILDLIGHWSLMEFSYYSISHILLFCIY